MKLFFLNKAVVLKITSSCTILALVFLMTPFSIIYAAPLTNISNTMSREKASVLSLHKVSFTSTSAIAAGNTIAITFPSGFTTTGLVITDLQICHGVTGVEHGTAAVTGGTACSSTDETLASSNGASTQWGAVISGTTTITLTAPSGSFTNTIAPGHKVTLTIAATHMQNPTASTPVLTIATTSDSGTLTLFIVDDDQVTISASVVSAITFDLDTYATSATSTETSSPYTVALGTLSTSGASGSNETSINGIWFDLGTNSSGGAVVTVISANGALRSTSVPTDTIPSVTGPMTAAVANYGICANRNAAAIGTLTKIAPFSSTCTTIPGNNIVGAVTTTSQTIYNTGGAPISGGRGEIMVNAENSVLTPAHADYSDMLTFVATGTF